MKNSSSRFQDVKKNTGRLPSRQTGNSRLKTIQPIKDTSPIKTTIPSHGTGGTKGRLPILDIKPTKGRPNLGDAMKNQGRDKGLTHQALPIDRNGRPKIDLGESRIPINEDRGRGEGREDGGLIGNDLKEGDVVTEDGTVVDQDFLDQMSPDDYIHPSGGIPWDDPTDPFWQQPRPDDWKGFWPEFPPADEGTPEDDTTPDDNPTPGDEGTPSEEGTPEEDPTPEEDGEPHEDHHPNPTCPPIVCPPHCPPVHTCPPCVTTICRPVTIIEETVIVEEEALLPEFELTVSQPAELAASGLGNLPGAVAIEVNGIGLPTPITLWENDRLQIMVPAIGLSGPTPAKLYVFNAQMETMAMVEVLLVTAAE